MLRFKSSGSAVAFATSMNKRFFDSKPHQMSKHNQDQEEKRSKILEELRGHFGEYRSGELADMDGLDLLTTFLRRILDTEADAAVVEAFDNDLSREQLRHIRRRRLDQKAAQRVEAPAAQRLEVNASMEDQTAAAQAMTFGALIDEIPRMRENLAEWLGSVDSDWLPSSSTPEELERLRERAEYRLKALTVMLRETQRELDALILAIRANKDGNTE